MVAACEKGQHYDDIVDVLRDMQKNIVFKSPEAAASAAALMQVIGIAADQIEYLRQGEPWISVDDFLPAMDSMGNATPVLVTMPRGDVTIGYCDQDEYGHRWHCESTDKPTHWKPLPSPAKKKNNHGPL